MKESTKIFRWIVVFPVALLLSVIPSAIIITIMGDMYRQMVDERDLLFSLFITNVILYTLNGIMFSWTACALIPHPVKPTAKWISIVTVILGGILTIWAAIMGSYSYDGALSRVNDIVYIIGLGTGSYLYYLLSPEPTQAEIDKFKKQKTFDTLDEDLIHQKQ